jgi:hypothetical protein
MTMLPCPGMRRTIRRQCLIYEDPLFCHIVYRAASSLSTRGRGMGVWPSETARATLSALLLHMGPTQKRRIQRPYTAAGHFRNIPHIRMCLALAQVEA